MFLLSAGSYVARTLGGPHAGLIRRRPALQPDGRPLEVIAQEARRLAARFHQPTPGTSFPKVEARARPRAARFPQPTPGTSFAKVEGARRAYEHVLTEACAALEVQHLLGVLPPGDELDVERVRVEGLLWLAGLRIDPTA